MELKPLQNSIRVFVKMYGYLLIVDILACVLFAKYDYAFSSVILLAGIVLSKFFFNNDKYDQGISFLAIGFYIVGFYHAYYLGNHNTCYFILLVVPVICSLLLENFRLKIVFIFASSILFVYCNYLAGLALLENYFFYFGLFPSSLLMMHFYEKLKSLSNEKNKLIEELKGKNDEILLFSNMMSHDLKTPLRNIEGFTSLLQQKLKGQDKQEAELFSFVMHGVKTMKTLIDDLLQYSKYSINEYSFKTLDLDNLIDELILSFNYDISKSKVEIIKSDLSTIYGHKESLSIVFQNLISNSIKYQPKDENHLPRIEISQVNEGQNSFIKVKDNGIGLDAKTIQEIVEPFKRFHNSSEYEGTGLGMSIVNKVLEKHKGRIEVESKLGLGSTFTVSIPKESKRSRPSKKIKSRKSISKSHQPSSHL